MPTRCRAAHAAPAARLGAGSDLPDLQRGYTRHRRATTGCGPRWCRKRCAWAACWPSWRATRPRCTQARVALMELRSSRGAARTDARGRPVLLMAQNRGRWDHLLIRRGLAAPARAGPVCGERRAARAPMRCRPPSPPAMHAPARRTRPTGRASWRSTTRWRRPRLRRWWRSTAQWRWAWPSGRRRRCRWSMRSPTSRR